MMTNTLELPITVEQIIQRLPHRYPFLLVDRIIDITLGRRIVALKNVTINESFFTGHFPQMPIMPGVLLIEAMAQSAGILSDFSSEPMQAHELYLLGAVDKVKFKRQVIPGDTLRIEVTLTKTIKEVSKYNAQISIQDYTTNVQSLVAKAEITIIKKRLKI